MPTAANLAVLMYHHVTAGPGSLAVSAQQFESQIRGLAEHGYQTIGSQQLAEFMAGKPIAKKSVLLTFDDGYLDNWVYAHPVLKRYNMRALLFAVTGLLGTGPLRPYHGQGQQVPECVGHHQAKEIMFSDQRDQVMLRWDEARAMVAAGTFEIHSHTHTHKRWDKLCQNADDKANRLAQDLADSRAMLQQQLGADSAHLCWPQGYFDADYLRVAKESGFAYLYTTDARGQNKPHGNCTHIYRFAVRNRPWLWLRQRLWLATHPYFGPLYNAWKARS